MPELRPSLIAIFLFFISLIVFWGPTDNWSYDPSFYYAQMRSPIIDRDFLFNGEIVPESAFVPTPNGFQYLVHPIGPSIFWSPFFLIAHVLTTLSVLPYPNDGLTPPYIAIVAAGSTLYGLVGLLLVYKTCRIYAPERVSLLTTVATLCATPLFYYLYRQPMMAHSVSFFLCALLLYVLLLLDKKVLPISLSGFLLGTIIGLAVLVRWLNVFLIPLPVALFVNLSVNHVQFKNWKSLRMLVLQGVVGSISAILVLLPQFAVWQIIYEKWLVMPRTTNEFTNSFFPIHFFDIFIHTNRGLIFWLPFALVSFFGLVWLHPRWLKIGCVLCVIVFLFIVGKWNDWHGGGGFGARFFIELLPILAIGMVHVSAQIINAFRTPLTGKIFVFALVCLMCFQQFALMIMVEQVSSGLDLAAYLSGQPLDVAIFKNSVIDLLREPSLIYAIRPNVEDDRQSILVGVLHNMGDFRVNTIELIGIPIIFFGFVLIAYYQSLRWVTPGLVGISLYCLAWFVFLLTL